MVSIASCRRKAENKKNEEEMSCRVLSQRDRRKRTRRLSRGMSCRVLLKKEDRARELAPAWSIRKAAPAERWRSPSCKRDDEHIEADVGAFFFNCNELCVFL